jgi:phosphoribosylformylglycinamidine cyclo-ligase
MRWKFSISGQLVLSPTRTYAPIIKKILDKYDAAIHGMVHCSGGAQNSAFRRKPSHHKDNLFPVPPLFKLIQEQSKTDWKRNVQVFNCGHRMEIYVPEAVARILSLFQNHSMSMHKLEG